MHNKWSILQDSEIWRFSFDGRNLVSYTALLADFIEACYSSSLSRLRKRNRASEETFSSTLENFIDYIEELKSLNNKGLYPRISSSSIFNFGKITLKNYCFDNSVYVYDRNGDIQHVTINGDNLMVILNEIEHGQSNETGLSLPFEFETYYGIDSDRNIKSYDFLIQFNSDIWLPKVPCIHCQKSFNNEQLRQQGGLGSVVNYWQDNTVLCELNRCKINLFLSKMEKICLKFNGQIIVEPEDLKLYAGAFNEKGFCIDSEL